ncbi:hypothetical protein [Gracilibacillus sp. JCM 18860]|uniref:hypothetical protein n=1 Tax=Gracilibacillus sp. JCM 18860 TaxID=1306159 RepID=UPI0006D13117
MLYGKYGVNLNRSGKQDQVDHKGREDYRGSKVQKGEQGIPGEPGEDGQSSYTHIAYADDEQGSGFSQQPEGKAYIGMYTDHTSADSTNPSDYKWSLIKGADGAQGVPGPKGDDGRTPYFHTAWANNATGTSGFSTTDSTDKLYIGTYTDFNAADSTDPSQYNWTKIKGGEKGDKGDQGPQGVQGPAGEDGGEPTYIWIRYADDDQGNGMSQYPDGKRYLGLAP